MKREKIQAPKGVSEYLPPDSKAFEWVREQLISSARSSGYQLIELPVFEDTSLFTRGVGQSTDVVSKEMYTFEDRAGRSLTLRPEGTAGVMRAVIEKGLDRGHLPIKVWYSGPFFRAERPQAGRYRQFYQVGIEAIGVDDPFIDAEVIAIADNALRTIGLRNYRLEITSLGDVKSRSAHRVELLKFISSLELDDATLERARLNPLRLFDDKRPEIQELMSGAPLLVDFLTPDSRKKFNRVCSYLNDLGIAFVINPKMVRGLDYYTETAFEFVHADLGAQSGIGGGGRYDGLMETLGGAALSGIGFGLGVDRILLAAQAEGVIGNDTYVSDLLIIPLEEDTKSMSLQIAQKVRQFGYKVEIAFGDRALKGVMKAADKSGCRYVVVIGGEELISGEIQVKKMSDGSTTSIRMDRLPEVLG